MRRTAPTIVGKHLAGDVAPGIGDREKRWSDRFTSMC
jgi:hypothetical protein